MPSSIFLGPLAVGVGAGGVVGGVASLIAVDTTQAATGNDTNPTVLFTYSLPANTLSRDGSAIRVTHFGSLAANGNTKTIAATFGSTTVSTDNGAINSGGWQITYIVVRTGSATQVIPAHSVMLRTDLQNFVAQTKDFTAAITLTVVGTNGSASANDIVYRGTIIESLPKAA